MKPKKTLTDVVGNMKKKPKPNQIISSATQVYKLRSNRKTPDVLPNLKNSYKLSTIVHNPPDWCD